MKSLPPSINHNNPISSELSPNPIQSNQIQVISLKKKMDTRTGSFSVQRTYDDFVPPQHLLQEETADTLLLELPGFRKEHIKVQIDNYGKLRISGERPVGGNKWVRFRKEHQVPENCNLSAIRAKYENGLVSIILPKVVAVPDQTDTRAADKTASQPTESTSDQTATQAADKPTAQPTEPSQQTGAGPTDASEEPRRGRMEPRRSLIGPDMQFEKGIKPAVDRAIDGQKKEGEPKDTSKADYEAHETAEESQDDTSESESKSKSESESESESEAGKISSNSQRLGMLKQKVGGLSTSMYNSRKAIWATFAVLAVSIGVGLMINYKLSENNMEA